MWPLGKHYQFIMEATDHNSRNLYINLVKEEEIFLASESIVFDIKVFAISKLY